MFSLVFSIFCSFTAHAEEPPKPPTWYGFMVVDVKQHKIALLHWQGEGDIGNATVVSGVPLGQSTPPVYTYPIPLPGFFTEVFEVREVVATNSQLTGDCSVTAFARKVSPEVRLTVGGVTGNLYQASLADEDLIGSKGPGCARLLDIKSPK